VAHGYQALTRAPDLATDWSRFQLYAPLIRSLVCSPTGNDDLAIWAIDDSIYRALKTSNLPRPILPKLNCLVWNGNEVPDDRYIDLFLGSQLTSLKMRVLSQQSTPQSVQAQSFASFGRSLPNLNSISITFQGTKVNREPRHDLSGAMSDLLCGLRGLKEVATSIPLNREAVLHLAASSCICLQTQNNAGDIVSIIAGFVPAPFPELVALTLTSDNFADVMQLIKLLNPEKLRHLAVCGARQNPEVILGDLHAEALDATCSHAELASYGVYRYRSFMRPSTEPPLPLSALAPLFTFKNITCVEISAVALVFDLDDDDIKHMATAWPRLQHISLWSIPGMHPMQSRATLASMITLVKRCHELQTIELIIHVDAVDLTLLHPEEANAVIRNEKITELDMRISSIASHVDRGAVADFLLKLFPHLADVYGTHLTPSWDDWLSVYDELQAHSDYVPWL
jgi:hypothetical protein